MKRIALTFGLLSWAALAWAAAARAQDKVIYYDRKTGKETTLEKCPIEAESPTGITVKGAVTKTPVPAADIIHLEYEFKGVKHFEFIKPFGMEKDTQDPKKAPDAVTRRKLWKDTIQ